MFMHNFKYTFKVLMRSRMLIFWTFVFPILLGTMFKLAFSNIENNEMLQVIEIAIVKNTDFLGNEAFCQTFEYLSDAENEERLFHTVYVTEDEAERLLAKDEIAGYLQMEGREPKLVIHKNGIEPTILQYVVDEIVHTNKGMEQYVEAELAKGEIPDEAEIKQKVEQMLLREYAPMENITRKNLSYTMLEYYTLIAMTCLYGGILGMAALNRSLPNMGNLGKRTAVIPVSKGKTILSSLLAAYLVQMIGLAILFLYTIFVMKVQYGNQLLYVILLAFAGSLAGLTLAIMITTLIKAGEGTKLGVLISITMVCCFLSGMMGITMKYIVEKKVPILDRINPAAMITDGYYALYYYGVCPRYWKDIAALLIFSVLMTGVSFHGLRRQKYDSI